MTVADEIEKTYLKFDELPELTKLEFLLTLHDIKN